MRRMKGNERGCLEQLVFVLAPTSHNDRDATSRSLLTRLRAVCSEPGEEFGAFLCAVPRQDLSDNLS